MMYQWYAVGILVGSFCFFFQAEDGIRDLVRSRGLGDVYKRQELITGIAMTPASLVSKLRLNSSRR